MTKSKPEPAACPLRRWSIPGKLAPWLQMKWMALLLAGGLWFVDGCARPNANRWQGYLEGEYVLLAAPLPGALEILPVKRGDHVKAGGLMFVLERGSETAAQREARERLSQARAKLENLKKGRRPTELAAMEARLAQARASLQLTEAELKRWEKLSEQGVASPSELDRARTACERDQRMVKEWGSELDTANLGARSDEIQAAEADVAAFTAALAKADWSLSQKTQSAPTNGMVFDTLYRIGEWVPAGSPVVSILPPGNIKVRFFVQETRIGGVRIGQAIIVKPDGAPQTYPAKINYISPQAEYTPPVIYSRENRAKLVFMVEAAFDSPDTAILHPGQPVEVGLSE